MTPHGVEGTYSNYGCRCAKCSAVHAAACARRRLQRIAGPTPDHLHGKASTYTNYGCRCRPCTDAWAAATRQWKAAARARAAAK